MSSFTMNEIYIYITAMLRNETKNKLERIDKRAIIYNINSTRVVSEPRTV